MLWIDRLIHRNVDNRPIVSGHFVVEDAVVIVEREIAYQSHTFGLYGFPITEGTLVNK